MLSHAVKLYFAQWKVTFLETALVCLYGIGYLYEEEWIFSFFIKLEILRLISRKSIGGVFQAIGEKFANACGPTITFSVFVEHAIDQQSLIENWTVSWLHRSGRTSLQYRGKGGGGRPVLTRINKHTPHSAWIDPCRIVQPVQFPGDMKWKDQFGLKGGRVYKVLNGNLLIWFKPTRKSNKQNFSFSSLIIRS